MHAAVVDAPCPLPVPVIKLGVPKTAHAPEDYPRPDPKVTILYVETQPAGHMLESAVWQMKESGVVVGARQSKHYMVPGLKSSSFSSVAGEIASGWPRTLGKELRSHAQTGPPVSHGKLPVGDKCRQTVAATQAGDLKATLNPVRICLDTRRLSIVM